MLKKQKKTLRFVAVFISALLLISFTACGNTESSSNAGGSSANGSAPSTGDDTVYTLKWNSVDPESNAVSQAYKAWAAELLDASDGRIKVDFYWSATLSAAADQYTSLLTGGSDIASLAIGQFTGTWPLIEAGAVPMLGENNCVAAGMARYATFEENEQIQEEVKDTKVLACITNELFNVISNGSDPSKLNNWKGSRIRTSGAVLSGWVEQLGAEAVSVPVSEAYEAYNKRIVDYVLWNWSGTPSFGLMDDTKYAMTNPIGFMPLLILMNKDTYDKLPADLQQILDEKSGYYLTEFAMKGWYEGGVTAIGEMVDSGHITFVDASTELNDAWKAASEKVKADYKAQLEGKGLDVDTYYAQLAANIEKYNKEYPNTTYEDYLNQN